MDEDTFPKRHRRKRRKITGIAPVRMQRNLCGSGGHAALDDKGNRVTIEGLKPNQIYVLLRDGSGGPSD